MMPDVPSVNHVNDINKISPGYEEISPLISLASNDVALNDIQMDLVQRGSMPVHDYAKEHLINQTLSIFAPIYISALH